MIWYSLNDELVEKYALSGKLVCTHSTLIELSSSYKIIRSPTEVKKAIRAIEDFGIIRTYENPFSFGLANFLPFYKPDSGASQRMWDNLKAFSKSKCLFPQERVEDMKSRLDGYNKNFLKSIGLINEKVISIKLNNKGKKHELDSIDYIKSSRRYLSQFLIQYYQEHINLQEPTGISLVSSNWENFDLIINVFALFFRDLNIVTNQKIRDNDWLDILNMIYVGPNDLYWTEERKWKRYMNSNKKISKYLYVPQLV